MAIKPPEQFLHDTLASAFADDYPNLPINSLVENAVPQKIRTPSIIYVSGDQEQVRTFGAVKNYSLAFVVDIRTKESKEGVKMRSKAIRALNRHHGVKDNVVGRVKEAAVAIYAEPLQVDQTATEPIHSHSFSVRIRA